MIVSIEERPSVGTRRTRAEASPCGATEISAERPSPLHPGWLMSLVPASSTLLVPRAMSNTRISAVPLELMDLVRSERPSGEMSKPA